MKYIKQKYIYLSFALLVILAGLTYNSKDAIADFLKLRVIPNSALTNATSSVVGIDNLRYVLNGATTSIEFSTDITDQVAVLIKSTASTSPAIVQFEVEYGLEVKI